jgi:hypothetical protein
MPTAVAPLRVVQITDLHLKAKPGSHAGRNGLTRRVPV